MENNNNTTLEVLKSLFEAFGIEVQFIGKKGAASPEEEKKVTKEETPVKTNHVQKVAYLSAKDGRVSLINDILLNEENGANLVINFSPVRSSLFNGVVATQKGRDWTVFADIINKKIDQTIADYVEGHSGYDYDDEDDYDDYDDDESVEDNVNLSTLVIYTSSTREEAEAYYKEALARVEDLNLFDRAIIVSLEQ